MLVELDSQIRSPASRKNQNTEVFAGVSAEPTVDLRHAYELARTMAKMQPQTRPGHRLVWVKKSAFASTMLVAADESASVIGRHTQCGVVLPDDPFVALRHVLVRS